MAGRKIRDLTFTQAHSFQAASALPIKLLQHPGAVRGARIRPIHLQLLPTNRCNANCPWCSCGGEDRSLELSSDELWDIISSFTQWGTKAITITGGGEPTLHAGLPRLIANASRLGCKVGLVTNGKVVPPELVAVGDHITWIRVSSAVIGPVAERAVLVAAAFPTTDVGISYTVTAELDMEDACATAEAACDVDNITHVRFVCDLTDTENAGPRMEQLESELRHLSPKLIFQHRTEWTRGYAPCRIGLLKPVLGADGYIYPCCGIQYAEIPGTASLTMPREARLCHWKDFETARPFDGSQCARCYYDDYNRALSYMTAQVGHRDFV